MAQWRDNSIHDLAIGRNAEVSAQEECILRTKKSFRAGRLLWCDTLQCRRGGPTDLVSFIMCLSDLGIGGTCPRCFAAAARGSLGKRSPMMVCGGGETGGPQRI